MVEITDFVKIGDVEPEVLETFADVVPADIVELWQRYGYGTFGNGYFRVINPHTYLDALGDGIGKITADGVTVPILTTALTDLITWEPNIGIASIRFRDETVTGAGFDLGDVMSYLDWPRADSTIETLNWAIYNDAVELHGVPPYGSSFTFVPLRSLGGPGTVETLKINETITAMQLMIELQGPIEH